MNKLSRQAKESLENHGFTVQVTKDPGKREVIGVYWEEIVISHDVTPRELCLIADTACYANCVRAGKELGRR